MNKFEMYKKDFLKSLSSEKKELLQKICKYSKCLCDFLFRHENYLNYFYDNLDSKLLGKEKIYEDGKYLLSKENENDFITGLTIFKMKHFGRIVSKDIYQKHSLPELMEEYSYLADATLEISYQKGWEIIEKKLGKPFNQEGVPVNASIVALGKLGGKELNYYSDIDLMYIYDDEGKTEKGYTNKEFFTQLFSKITQFLTKRNVEGQTWIVDLDLRPNGKSGFISYSIPALEIYYWTVGRVWERHMLIKARHSAGNKGTTQEFLKLITPFVYRKTITKEEIEEIVEMKQLIQAEAEKGKNNEFDVKKGSGGIREIEFTAQILQLIYAGKNKKLMERSTYKAIQKLKQEKILKSEEADLLSEAYLFYRKLEHIIQIENCIQTQKFKYEKANEYANRIGVSNGEELINRLNYFREKVKEVFNSLDFGKIKELTPIQKYIFTKHYEEEALNYLQKLGFTEHSWALERIKEIFFSRDFIILSEDFKEVLFNFIPELEKQLKEFDDRRDFLRNLNILLIEGKMLPIFASALKQNKKLVEFILNIAKVSDYISKLMSNDPQLLDFAFGVEDILETKQDFENELELIKNGDLIEKLNKVKNIVQVLSSLKYLSQINKKNSKERLKELNTILSNLAEFNIEKLYQNEAVEGLIIYGLGKIGSREMNIGSDLDIVFAFSNLDNKQNYSSAVLNIIKNLTKYTKEGILYQIDLRLRPFGKSGELAPTLNFYKNYFQKEARSWERLAWTKSRFIKGEEKIKDKMEDLINEFLFSTPINKEFVYEIYEMRMKLEGVSNERTNEIDIKLGYGGIVDLEFLGQLKILKEKKRETNILSIIEKYYPELLDSYLFLREVETRLRMIKGTGISRISKKSPFLYRVAHSFSLEPEDFWEKLLNTRKKIRNNFLKIIKED